MYAFITILLAINYKFNPSSSATNRQENATALSILTMLFMLTLMINMQQYYFVYWLVFNALFIGLILILFRIGYDRKDLSLVNLASFSSFFFIVAKFFDLFSNLLDNGITWLLFGILLIWGSIFFEKRRRKIRDSINNENKLLVDGQ